MISKTGRRPLGLSRYGGIGNQRYGIGFSGDTESTWSTLKYEVEMTSTVTNALGSDGRNLSRHRGCAVVSDRNHRRRGSPFLPLLPQGSLLLRF